MQFHKNKTSTRIGNPSWYMHGKKRKPNYRALLAMLVAGASLPVMPPAQSVFAAMRANTQNDPTERIMQEASEPKATLSDAEEEVKPVKLPDGFFADQEAGLCYRKDGETVKNEWIQVNDAWFYATENGHLASGWLQVDDIWYYFDRAHSLHDGWLLDENGDWYYLTENGMLTGYQTLDEDDFYFYEDGRLAMDEMTPDGRMADTDGYLFSPQEEFGSFQYEKDTTGGPGALSGMSIAGEPVEFYMLSIAGETSGGQIVMGDRGRAYGLCQLDYRYDLTEFIRWAYNRHPKLWAELEVFTAYQDNDPTLVGNAELRNAFTAAMNRSYEGAVTDQLEFMRARYWDNCHAKMNAAGFNLDERHVAVSAAIFSVNVNCGSQPDVFINHLSPDMTDAEMICEIYQIRNTILADQMVGHVKKGTTGRYRKSEPEMALDLLYGYTTVDSKKYYGSGVRWAGNIFSDSVLTVSIAGQSTDWDAYIAEQAMEEAAGETDSADETATPSDAAEEPVTEETEAEVKEAYPQEVGPGIATPAEAESLPEETQAVTEPGPQENLPEDLEPSSEGETAIPEKQTASGPAEECLRETVSAESESVSPVVEAGQAVQE